ncbi:MAG: 30S ribosomal protein S2 [Acidobacteria bacterium]|nr:30S ribosomal protein S2 [Acidobacteriota bacterium]MBU4495807.1 30S ribosomal protein S2 [Acidobacteriota bacterium]MCG2815494.1 30S ribosomal protein S2 [Candidatus Aminicenantes bacterium]
MVSVTMKELLEAGVHFGHQTKRWNPKMKDYIFGQRNGIYIIDLQKTIKIFKEALQYIRGLSEEGKEILLVGTKKQAQDIIKDMAEKCEACYVNQRWLGGLLTNFSVIRGSVDRLIELDEMKEDGRWDLKSKKEQSKLEKVYRKLNKNLGGIRTMTKLPGALVIIDSTKEDIAILEALKLKIPIVAIVDTNGNPENITYPIPGNDDAVRAIELFTSKIAEAIMEGKKARIDKELQEEAEEDVSDDAVKLEAVADEPEETVEAVEAAEAVEATEVSKEPKPSADTAEEENVVEETAHEEPVPENDEKQE